MMKRIGIIGGGQLGMFLASTAYKMGLETIVYDANVDCCASGLATKFIHGSFDDYEKLEKFCQYCDVITYEFENINSEIISKLSIKYPIVQKAHPLILSSSRLNERKMAQKLQITQPNWKYVEKIEDLDNIRLQYPYLLKSNSLGYDGKGQYMINNEDDIAAVKFGKVSYLAESKIAFDYEMSIIGVQSINKEITTYPPFYNVHEQGILKLTLINQAIPLELVNHAQEVVKLIMKTFQIYGLLCCEFFVKGDDIYFNELAARPHNSGHITMDTHYTSQYENHIRALLGMKLGSTSIKCQGYMVNVLGQDVADAQAFMRKNGLNSKYYDYHKKPLYNRKVGHLVVFDNKYLDEFKKTIRSTTMNRDNVLYEGKAKYILETENPEEIIVYFKDDATAFNGVKKASIENKGILNNKISTIIFNYLKANGIKTHHLETIDNRRQLCQKVKIIPLEFICRNIVAGAMSKRLGIEEGLVLDSEVLEICYKKDELNDPLLNDYHAFALKVITKEQLEYCYDQVIIINKLLKDLFKNMAITLVDFKIEFGLDKAGNIVLADEFSPDNCRLWETDTNKKLDKDVFRRDLGDISATYQIVLDKLEAINQ